MANKRGAAASEEHAKKKQPKRPSKAASAGVEEEEAEEEEEHEEIVLKKKGTAATKPSSSSSSESQQQATTTAPDDTNLRILKERFNSLHDLRFTEPEKQCNELLQLVQDQKTAHDFLVRKLESKISTLEQETKELAEAKKREHKLLEENSIVRAEVEQVRKSLGLADQERAALVRALEVVDDSKKDSANLEQIVGILNAFKSLTGITLILDEGNVSQGSCTVYNAKVKKGVRFRINFAPAGGGQEVTFTPQANKNLLPMDMRNQPTTCTREETPHFVARVMQSLFLSS